jgi:hypothetical protein
VGRYAKPRTLKTKRGELKALNNAWCLKCRKPMERHGKSFTCTPCRSATRVQFIGPSRLRGERVKINPWCLRCRKPMAGSFGKTRRRFACLGKVGCGAFVTAHTTRKGKIEMRKARIAALVAEGYLNKDICRRVGTFNGTVREIRATLSARLCLCGQLFHHHGKCDKRPGWQTVARERRSDFDDLLMRINRRVPRGLPEEMREEICQQMLFDIAQSINDILSRSQDFIRQYKKTYPFAIYSIDADPTLAERLVG